MLIPRLCEIFAITSDELLGVSGKVREKGCTEAVFAYAKEVGECRAAYEAVRSTSYLAERDHGTAKMASDGVKIHTSDGLAIVVNGREMMERLKSVDVSGISAAAKLIGDERVMAVVRVLDYGDFASETEIAQSSGLAADEVERVLFRLLKQGIVECDPDGGYAFGAKSYLLFAMLAGAYVNSQSGIDAIGTLTCSFTKARD